VDGVTLALDAAAGRGTVAVFRDATLVAEREVEMRSADEETFLPAVIATLGASSVAATQLTRIVCGAGPGSFTSLRVVGAAAKGLAQGLGVPLLAVPSLALIVAAHEGTRAPGSRWLATLDAMRDERYLALVTIGDAGEVARYESQGLVPNADVPTRAAALGATAVGPHEALRGEPHARGVGRAAALILGAGAVDLASWEPAYGRLAEAQVKWEAAQGRALR
jgi:tRNA threonylcarbamoyladenosine biosynthesis protein TsaB